MYVSFPVGDMPISEKTLSLLLDEDRIAITGPILVELIQGTRTVEEKEGSHFSLIAHHSALQCYS
jgi:hypothetical protein